MHLAFPFLTAWGLSIVLLESTAAFTSPSRNLQKSSSPAIITMTPKAPTHSSPISVVGMAVDESSSEDDTSSAARVAPGTQEELLYALGVNLARQLGDIRPLVNDGEELANVAKGLLDTVVGRLDDEGQRKLLASRGQELDQMIVSRA